MGETIEPARNWLLQLGVRIAPTIDEREFTGRVAILAEDLAEDYPERVFCRSSLLFVAKQCRFWPNFAELCEHLNAWQRSQNPYPIYGGNPSYGAIPPPPPEKRGARDDEERQWARKMVRNVSAQLAEIGNAKRDAMQAQLPPRPPTAPLSRTQLVEAYKRAGVKGPQITEPQAEVVPLRSAATAVHSEVRRGPPIDAQTPDA